MKRHMALLVSCAVFLVLGVSLIPQGHAKRNAKPAPAIAKAPLERLQTTTSGSDDQIKPEAAGLPNNLNAQSALSAALFTAIGGPNTQFDEVPLIANWDGREDYVADRAQKVDDLSFVLPLPTQFVTRTAVSEHTFANGFAENVFYYGDSAGNFMVGTDTNPGIISNSNPAIDVLRQVSIPNLINTNTSGGITLLNPTGGDCSSATITVTGIAVNPVADLSDFTGVACDTIGEVVYVSVLDATGCGTIKSRILAFAFTDGVGAAAATPQGALQLLRNPLSNAGIAVDDDGSLYFHLVDLSNLSNGGAIFKVTETPRTVAACAANPRVNRMVASIPNGLNGLINTNTAQGTAANPIIVAAGQRLSNYSGPSTTFGNIVAIAAGPANAIYAALSSSAGAINPQIDGLFTNPVALGATPSMIISFADRTGGGRDICSSPDGILPGVIPIADGLSDVAQAGLTRDPGVNNFRAFVLGAGPDRRGAAAAAVFGTTANTLKIDMQIDFSIHAGLVADETGAIYVIAGGTPSGVGLDPSPFISEILAFPDSRPADRRADYIDLRGNGLPNPPASGGNVGDGDSDRFDHIFLRAPVDQVSLTPSGLSGLSRGFLRYTNRLAPTAISPGVTLGTTQKVQGDDDTTGAPILFENLDPGHQVAGGDDQNTPFRGDDNDGAGTPPLVGPLNGGFEFTFGGPVGTAGCVWNGFFLNSNGNITFGAGDTANVPSVTAFREGLPKIAGAWDDLNPNSRAANAGTFPVQALGFADVNAFKVRYIDVPQFGDEGCTGSGGQASNTFSMTLFDDGSGIDENANQPLNPANPIGNNAVPFDLQEGPNDLRFALEPNTNFLLGANPRREGSGNFVFNYGRMDLLGTAVQPVITGYSIGALSPTNPPGICETNLGNAAVSASSDVFGTIQSQTASIDSSLIGEGTEPTLFELFENGRDGSIAVGGGIIVANVDFDLRFEGNDPAEKSAQQTDGDRSEVGFFGIGCAPPANPQVLTVTPVPPVLVAPGQPAVGTAAASSVVNSQGQQIATPTSGIINALGAVQLNILGNGFYQNEVTTICPGGVPAGDVPTERPGKTITTAAVLALDSNNDGVPDTNVALTNVTVLSRNLIRATAAPLATAPGTAFPLNLPGGLASLTTTTTFTAADNNAFGALTRTSAAVIDTGRRAPVIVGTSAVQGNCGLPQDLLISGFNFLSPFGPIAVGGVKAVQEDNPANVIPATSFTVLNSSLIEARFDIGSANIGRTFRIFVTGPGGQSRNLLSTDPRPVGVPTGNEQGNAIIFTCSTPVSGSITFSANSYFVSEGTPAVTITAKRENSSGALTVDYSTSDGTATQRADYTMAVGQITFAPGEATKTFQVLVNDDSYSEITESVNLTLTTAGNGAIPPGATSATLNITDNDNPPASANVIDTASDFVTQQYHDFLNRDPDPSGLAFWTNEITSCGANAACIDLKRQNVSAAFFLSIEFQETGGDVIRTQRVAFGRRSDDATSRTTYEQFLRGARRIGQGVIVGQAGYQAVLETNRQDYATDIVTSTDFATRFPTSLDASSYVDALFMSAGLTPTSTERSAAIAAFGGVPGRVAALRSVANSNSVHQAEFNASFVLMQYYGYLRRNPTDPPDGNDDGYQFWRTKLNSFGGNFVQAEMVRAFLLSGEYRQRFGR